MEILLQPVIELIMATVIWFCYLWTAIITQDGILFMVAVMNLIKVGTEIGVYYPFLHELSKRYEMK